MSGGVFYQWPKPRYDPATPRRCGRSHPDADRLFVEHRRLFLWLARRWFGSVNPYRDRAVSVEDVAAEFVLQAVRSLHRFAPERGKLSTWIALQARDRAHKLRRHAVRAIRGRATVGQFAHFAGDEFDRFAATADPRQREPWEILADLEE